jgi:hypothetical protein
MSTCSNFKYLTFVGREAARGSLAGRMPAAIRDGRLERAAALELAPETSQVTLCDNPEMLKEASAALAEQGAAQAPPAQAGPDHRRALLVTDWLTPTTSSAKADRTPRGSTSSRGPSEAPRPDPA